MEFNQEYYKTVTDTTWRGQPLGYSDGFDVILPKMNNNGLTRLDPSNIWCLAYGSPLFGSGGASGLLASRYITKTSSQNKGSPEFSSLPYTFGPVIETTGDLGKYSAVRWVMTGTYANGFLTTKSTNTPRTSNTLSSLQFITKLCIKNLIAVPRFTRETISVGSSRTWTNITYEQADAEFSATDYINYSSGSHDFINLRNIDFYYGDPGKRAVIGIVPLFESNYNGVHYFSTMTAFSDTYAGVFWGVGGRSMNVGTETESYAYINQLDGAEEDMFIDSDGLGVSARILPVWAPAWFSRSLLYEILTMDGGEGLPYNTTSTIKYSPEADCGIFVSKESGTNTSVGRITTPYGARAILNALGIVWAEDEVSAINYDPDAASAGAYKVHIGVMEPGGITTGEMSDAEHIKDHPNFGICNIQDTIYDGRIPDNPGQNVDPDTGNIPLNTPGVTPFNTFNHMYCMTQSEVNDFASKIWNADETLWEQIVSGLSLYGEMPINAIISLRMYPIDLLKLFDVASTSIMRIGKTAITLDSQTEFVTKQKTAVVNMGSCVFPARYNNFLDYEPYTKAMLYLPYCGTVDVATADVVGKTVQVYYIIDVMTGGCTAVVYFGGIPYFYKNGRVGVEIPITANADSAVTSDALSLVTGGASSLLAAATGNPVAAALSLPSMVNSGLQLAKDSRSSFQTTGTQTPTAAQWTPQNAYFIVQRSVPDEPAGYGHSVGYVTLEGGTLGSFTGYTVMSNPDLTGVDCTEGEKEMIRNLLESGIYC